MWNMRDSETDRPSGNQGEANSGANAQPKPSGDGPPPPPPADPDLNDVVTKAKDPPKQRTE